MASTRAAIRYAKAILDLSYSKGVAEIVNANMILIENSFKANLELSNFIQSPTTSVDIKENVLNEVFSNVNEVTKNLFRLLRENKRFEIIVNIASDYIKLFDEMNNIEVATVTTAFPMDVALETKVLAKIATFSDKNVSVNNLVDPTIIGGFILRMGDKQYNASIANRLQVLKRELSN